VGSTCA